MATVRRLSRQPISLLVLYLGAICAVQLELSAGGLVRWSDYSVLAPLIAAALVSLRQTFVIGAATLVASVAVYGLALQDVPEGSRVVVIAAAALSFVLSLATCRARLRLQLGAPTPAKRLVHDLDHTRTRPGAEQAVDTASGAASSPSVARMTPDLLPRPVPVELASSWRTARGTAQPEAHWLDAIPLPGGRVALVAGAVAAHERCVPAIVAELRAAVRTLAGLDLQPEELLAHLADVSHCLRPDNEPCRRCKDMSPVTASCLYVVYDPVSAHCTVVSAGSLRPTLLMPDGVTSAVDVAAGPLLGEPGPPVEATEVVLPEGSVLLLHAYVPGTPDPADLTDATVFPTERLVPHRCLSAVCHSALDALLSGRHYDQAAVLAARTRTFDSSTVAFWDLSADVAAVSQARKHAWEKLTAWSLEDVAPATELIVSELVTNAIRHASPPIRLRLIRHEGALTCEVSDGSTTSPHLRRARNLDESGRGLFIVAQLTRRWGTRHNSDGKTIWAEQSRTAEEPLSPRRDTSACQAS